MSQQPTESIRRPFVPEVPVRHRSQAPQRGVAPRNGWPHSERSLQPAGRRERPPVTAGSINGNMGLRCRRRASTPQNRSPNPPTESSFPSQGRAARARPGRIRACCWQPCQGKEGPPRGWPASRPAPAPGRALTIPTARSRKTADHTAKCAKRNR